MYDGGIRILIRRQQRRALHASKQCLRAAQYLCNLSCGASISITFQGPRSYQALPTMQFIWYYKSSAKLSGQVESTARKGGSSS